MKVAVCARGAAVSMTGPTIQIPACRHEEAAFVSGVVALDSQIVLGCARAHKRAHTHTYTHT
eukprot:1160442-Pelagomonas_calceolata.AAC.2